MGNSPSPSELERNVSKHASFSGVAQDMAHICRLLEQGEITDCRPVYSGSNRVFLITAQRKGATTRCVYKPCRGEAPLWDFPDGTLYKREYAAYLVSQLLEWFLVPPTVIREGPYGVGSVQWFVPARSGDGYNVLREKRPDELKRVAAFDLLVNNTDRKAGHCIEGDDGRVWLIDHGLTFNAVPKLRTVIWDFAGQPIPAPLVADVALLQEKLKEAKEALARLLADLEIEALEHRIRRLISNPIFPHPESYRSVPWPPF